jgi:WD40 repeat protein
MDWSPDGSELAVGYSDGTVQILNAAGQLVRTLQIDLGIRHTIDWHPTENKIAIAAGGNIYVLDARTGATLLSSPSEDSEGFLVQWSPDGETLAVSGAAPGDNHAIYLLDPSTGAILRSISGPHADALTAMEWSPDGSHIASGDGDGLVVIWDTATRQPVVQFLETQTPGGDWVKSLAWSPDGTRIATAGDFQTVQVWNAATGQRLFAVQPEHSVEDIAWSPDGTRIAGVQQNAFFVWDAQTGQEVDSISGIGSVSVVAWSPDGTQLAYSGAGETVEIVHAPSAETPTPVPSATPCRLRPDV